MTLDLFQIRRGVGSPTPRPPVRRGRWKKLPLDDLEIGDVVEITLSTEEVSSNVNAIRSHVSRHGTKTAKSFSVTTKNMGICVWRTA